MAFKATPLPHEWMIVGIIGFFVSIFLVSEYSKTWSFAFSLLALCVVIASIVSAETQSLDDASLDRIAGEPYASKKRPTIKK